MQAGTHTLDLEHLGGLLRRMPKSGFAFFVGAAAIVGLPPLNGFVSEFAIFVTGFLAVAGADNELAAGGAATVLALALISGLAAACFAKVVGVVYLGTARSPAAEAAREVPASMYGPMLALASLCGLVGIAGPLVVAGMATITSEVTGVDPAVTARGLAGVSHSLAVAVAVFVVAAGVAGALWRWRRWRLTRYGVRSGPTWGCGYRAATARMQYTASSFADPLNRQFTPLMHVSRHVEPPQGLFPTAARLRTESNDPFYFLLFAPTFSWIGRVLKRAEVIQRGHTHIYVLYIAVTLLVVLTASILGL